MARRYYSSTAVRTTLSSSISDSATSFTVAAVNGFPASFPYTLIIDEDTAFQEVVEVTSRSGTTLTVVRGVDGTTAFSHSSGAAVNHGVSARDYGEPNEFVNTVGVELQQFAAAGSVLDNLPARVPPAEQLLKQSVLWLDAAHSSAGDQEITNLGWGGAALNAQSGSTSGADSNDPLFLDWTGENYVYLPGVASNYLSVPDEAALDITGDIDIRVQVALDDWTPGAANALMSKLQTGGQFSWVLYLLTTGTLQLSWYTDGTTAVNKASTIAPTVTDGAIIWVRATLDVNNGASGNDVKFYTSNDGATWTQLGTTVTTAGVTSIFSSTSQVEIGTSQGGTALPSTGKIYRAQIFNGIDGTKVLDVDTSVITSGSAPSLTALTGQTVTLTRSTAGRKAVAVVSPVWLFGTDDYMDVTDNDLIDFGASDSFTVLAVVRQWATPGSFMYTVSKNFENSPWTGYGIRQNNVANQFRIDLADVSTNRALTTAPSHTLGALTSITTVVNRSTNQLFSYTNGVASAPTSISGIGNSSNGLVFRIGSLAEVPFFFASMELLAVAVFRRALTAGEITTLNTYYQSRIGG